MEKARRHFLRTISGLAALPAIGSMLILDSMLSGHFDELMSGKLPQIAAPCSSFAGRARSIIETGKVKSRWELEWSEPLD